MKCQYCQSVVTPDHTYSTWVGNKDTHKGIITLSYRCGRKNAKKYTTTCPTIPIPAGSLEKLVVNFIKDLFDNPDYVFNFQKELSSNKLQLKHLQERAKRLQRTIETFPGRRTNIRKQHELTGKDDIFVEQMKVVEDTERNISVDLARVKAEINRITLPTHHIQSFLEFAEKYKDKLGDVLLDRQATYELIHLLLE